MRVAGNFRIRTAWAALALFAILTTVMTCPLVAVIDNGALVDSDGQVRSDPLLSMWILAAGAHNVIAQPGHLFDGNILWPRRKTLAYADHLMGNLPISVPVFWLTGNAVLVHNVLVWLTFCLSGWGAFLLVRELTRSGSAGLVAGCVFAFALPRFAQIDRIHVISTQWMPFTLFYLHRYAATRRRGHLLAFWLFLFWQGLSCTYYLVYFSTFMVLACATWLLAKHPMARRMSCASAVGLVIAGILWLPFLMPYRSLRQDLGHRREIDESRKFSASLASFVSAPHESAVYRPLLARPDHPEKRLFPGLMLCALFAAAWLMRDERLGRERLVYSLLALMCVALAFGPRIARAVPGPYALLYHLVPGYDALRAPARFFFVGLLAASVVAGFGAQALRSKLGRFTAHGLIVFVLVENMCAPLPYGSLPVGRDMPGYARWLRDEAEDAPALILPSDLHLADLKAMYHSTYHWRPIVNGETGHMPPGEYARFMLFAGWPAQECVDAVRALGIRYIVWRCGALMYPARTRLRGLSGLELVASVDDDFIFAVDAAEPAARAESQPLPRDGWRLHSAHNATALQALIDGDPATAWRSGDPQTPGLGLSVDLGTQCRLRGLRIDFGRWSAHFPRYLDVHGSDDGIHWRRLFPTGGRLKYYASIYTSAVRKPSKPSAWVDLGGVTVRHIRLSLGPGVETSFDWTMTELEAF